MVIITLDIQPIPEMIESAWRLPSLKLLKQQSVRGNMPFKCVKKFVDYSTLENVKFIEINRADWVYKLSPEPKPRVCYGCLLEQQLKEAEEENCDKESSEQIEE